ncbi:hypothetical protein [Herbaspirillum rubrisubalbicans]|uniref:hypothetical protein n=1 Tax=Herbaspirillum rubrisubalbicans TaxID=80842 RepID=UPI0015C54D5B|nr:hypothetical protein [Herbaspirillum rubrisubalbicans]
MTRPKYSLREVESILADDDLQNFLRRKLAATYDEVIDILYEELDLIIADMERNPQHYIEKEEDEITGAVVSALRHRSYSATQGTTSGGNVDITVSWPKHSDWTWICEAKIYNSIKSLDDGYLQLTTRYQNASLIHDKRGLLAYTKRPKASALLKQWDDHLARKDLDGYSRTECKSRPQFSFYSTHVDPKGGHLVPVRHLAVALYHMPQDTSGKNAKKYVERRKKLGL